MDIFASGNPNVQIRNIGTKHKPNNQMPDSFYTNMFDMQNKITAVWQTGAIPSFSGNVYFTRD